jgi:hypothetical protein
MIAGQDLPVADCAQHTIAVGHRPADNNIQISCLTAINYRKTIINYSLQPIFAELMYGFTSAGIIDEKFISDESCSTQSATSEWLYRQTAATTFYPAGSARDAAVAD